MKTPMTKVEKVLSILWSLTYILILTIDIMMSLNFHWFSVLVFAVPLIFFLIVIILRVQQIVGAILSTVLIVLVSLIFIVLMFFNMIFMGFSDADKGTSNVINYKKMVMLNYVTKSNLTSHFPKKFPGSATAIRYWHQPGLMQGGSITLLRYNASSTEIDSLYEKYEKTAKSELKSSDIDWTSTRYRGENSDVYLPLIFDTNVGYNGMPKDFDIIVIDSKPYQENSWNHGYSYGLAISRELLEVLFWSSNW